MNTSPQAWIPAGQDLSREQALALSVPARAKPTPDLYRDLLAQKLQALIDADPKEAQRALEMSQEQAPEWWTIAEYQPPRQWGQALTSSDSIQIPLSLIDWTQEGNLREAPPEQTIRNVLEVLTP